MENRKQYNNLQNGKITQNSKQYKTENNTKWKTMQDRKHHKTKKMQNANNINSKQFSKTK